MVTFSKQGLSLVLSVLLWRRQKVSHAGKYEGYILFLDL